MNRLVQIPFRGLIAQIGGQGNAMLKHATVEIYNIERPIGAGGEVDWTKAFVGGGKELCLVVGIFAKHGAIGFGENVTTDQISGRFSDKGIAVKILGKKIAVEN